jgi:hypothetical protein
MFEAPYLVQLMRQVPQWVSNLQAALLELSKSAAQVLFKLSQGCA